jgi:hypothetical protein
MAIVTVQELRDSLGLLNVYSDADLESCIETAESVLLPYLTQNVYALTYAEVTSNVATVYTRTPHPFVVGQTISAHGTDGSTFHTANNKVITAVSEYTISFAYTNPNLPKIAIIPNGWVGVQYDYEDQPQIHEAVLQVSQDVFQSRYAPGGQPVNADFTPAPYVLGRSLLNRISALLGAYIDTQSLVQ